MNKIYCVVVKEDASISGFLLVQASECITYERIGRIKEVREPSIEVFGPLFLLYEQLFIGGRRMTGHFFKNRIKGRF